MLSQLRGRARRNRRLLTAVRATYPALSWVTNRRRVYLRIAPYLADMRFDEVRLGGRGNEPEAHLRRTERARPVRDADVLVLGAGRGEELDLWRRQRPRSLTAVEYLDYHDAWRGMPEPRFARGDVRALAFADRSFDIVASTALLEHVDDVDAAAREMARVVRPDGLVFANFGPLYHTYGGAHYEGAFEHLSMTDAQFEQYLVARNRPGEIEDGLLWLRNGMFSKLRYDDYLAIFDRYFTPEHVVLAVSPAALRYQRQQPERWRALRQRFDDRDLLTYAMTVWLRPKPNAVHVSAARIEVAA